MPSVVNRPVMLLKPSCLPFVFKPRQQFILEIFGVSCQAGSGKVREGQALSVSVKS